MTALARFVTFITITFIGTFALSQSCDGGTLYAYGTSYAIRSGGNVITSNQAYVTGADSEYTTTTVQQTDTYFAPNGSSQANGQPFSASAGPGGTAQTVRNSPITSLGYGTYEVQGFVSAYDACDGRQFPPYDTGNGITNAVSITVVQPTATSTNSEVYLHQFPAYNANGSTTPFPTFVEMYPNLQGASGTPVWTVSGAAANNVTVTNQPPNEILITPNSNVSAGCFVQLQAQFTVDGLTSTSANVIFVSATQVTGYSPVSNQPVDHLAIAGGYTSNWYFQDVNSCGEPMPYVAGNESFPNGFTRSSSFPNSNWNFPTANSWYAGSTGGWSDQISFSDTTGSAYPTPSAPMSPLGTSAVFYGAQSIFVGPVNVVSDTQTHYVDHGDYNPPSGRIPPPGRGGPPGAH